MKKILVIAIVLAGITFSSCNKKSDCNFGTFSFNAPDSEQQAIQEYLGMNGLSAQKLPSGLYYKIIDPGSGVSPVLCSNIVVKYTARLTDGTIFEQTPPNETRTFQLGTLIVGWQLGLPLIQKGGSITLFIPPSFGYGSDSITSVPPNSILIFDVELVDFK